MNLLHEPEQLKWLGTYYQINPIFSQGILVINRSGLVIADYPNLPHRIGLSLADRDYFQQAINGQSYRSSGIRMRFQGTRTTHGRSQQIVQGIRRLF